MLAPFSIAGGLVVNTGKELEFLNGNLFLFYAELVLQLALRRSLRALNGVSQVGAAFAGDA